MEILRDSKLSGTLFVYGFRRRFYTLADFFMLSDLQEPPRKRSAERRG